MLLRATGIPQNREIRFRANVGSTMDIPTGRWHNGKYGESLMNGGIPLYFGIAGKANNFKTTTLADLIAIIMSRYCNMQSQCQWLDEEETSDMARIARIMSRKPGFERYRNNPMGIFSDQMLLVTDSSAQSANKWWEQLQEFIDNKVKDKRWNMATEFVDINGNFIEFQLPSLSAVDSISELETDNITAMRDKTEVGDKEAQTLYMRQGLSKDRIIREARTLSSRGTHFIGMTAQWGEDKADIGGPPGAQKARKMNTIRPGEKIRGVPDSFLYLPQQVWLINGSENLKDDSRTGAEFPLDMDSSVENLDLWRCPASMVRSKTGMSAFTLDLIVSQNRGLQPTLTEFFHVFRKKKRWGIEGSGQYYTFDLMPELKLQRTEVRRRIDENAALRRAINITSEIAQIGDYDVDWSSRIPPMKDLRARIESKGYDWKTLLDTRHYFTFNAHKDKELPFLSSMDLLKMFYDEYEPYWYDKSTNGVRKEFARKVPA